MQLTFVIKQCLVALLCTLSFDLVCAVQAQEPAQRQALTAADITVSDVSFTPVKDRDRAMLYVSATVTNSSPHLISGLLAQAYIWGERPAPLKRVHMRELGGVIAGGLLPGESLIVKGDVRLDQRAASFIEDTSKLRLVLDVADILDETGHSMTCAASAAGYGHSKGPSPRLCAAQ